MLKNTTFCLSLRQTLPGNLFPERKYPTPHVKKNEFEPVQLAKFARLYPVKYHGFKAVRMELYGLKQGNIYFLLIESAVITVKISDSTDRARRSRSVHKCRKEG